MAAFRAGCAALSDPHLPLRNSLHPRAGFHTHPRGHALQPQARLLEQPAGLNRASLARDYPSDRSENSVVSGGTRIRIGVE